MQLMQDDLKQIVSRLLQDVNTPKLEPCRLEAKRIQKKYTPREIFNRWRSSDDGKQWKKEQFECIKHKCPGCGHILPNADHFQIDHIKSLRDHPDLMIEPKNLRLLCGPCNQHKGAANIVEAKVKLVAVHDSQLNCAESEPEMRAS
jgi:5-methylcytosine-specific restriction endonuclease McrA